MSEQNFQLSWSNFEKCTLNTFEKLFTDEEFTDVTLACDGDKQLKVHKAIISYCSPIFKHILTNNKHNHPLIYLRGISHITLSSVIQFMYLGRTEVPQNMLDDFMCVAQEFGIERFSKDGLQKGEESVGIDEDAEFDKKIEVKGTNGDDDGTKNLGDTLVSFNKSYQAALDEEKLDAYEQNSDNDMLSEVKHEGNNVQEIDLASGIHKKRKYQCKQCEKQFSDPSPLSRHLKSVHEGVTFKCNVCHREFSQKFHLKKHYKSKHLL